MFIPKTLEYCQNLAKLKNGKCTSTEYKNANTKMAWECQEGHRWEAKRVDIRHGTWCPYCAGNIPKNIEWCQTLASKKNGKCNSKEYKNNHTLMKWECQEGHEWEAITASIRQGNWCPYCAGKAPKNIEWCQELATKKGGRCLSIKYKNTKDKMKWECQEGHRWKAIAASVQQGNWCPECAGRPSRDLLWCQELAVKRKGKCLSIGYTNAKTKMGWECQEGHRWEAVADSIKRGSWCPHCKPQYSKSEKQIFEFIGKIYPEALPNKKRLLKSSGLELDIYIPSLRVGIEYDGKHWHNNPKTQERDSRKTKECQEAGIKLIRISEGEYLKNPALVVQNLLQRLNMLEQSNGRQ